MDIALPKHDGIFINRAIRKKYPDAIIIALSSFDKAEILEKDPEVFFNAYLKKPLGIEALAECLKPIMLNGGK